MRRYLTISAGRCAAEAAPVVSSSDAHVVDAALTAIHQRLSSQDEEGGPIQAPKISRGSTRPTRVSSEVDR